MKLVEILARELEEWPEPDEDYGLIESMSQAADLQVSHYAGVRQKWLEDIGDWEGGVSAGYVPCSRFTPGQLATDHATAIVTRADWEAERANINAALVITASKPKANGYGWVRHRGGKCPVGAGTLVEVRNRAGDIALKDGASCTSVSWHWSHDNHPGDIMAYKIHKPADQPYEHDLTSLAEKAGINRMAAVASEVIITSGPIEWRDQIRALDTQREEVESTYQRQISEITQERESLVQKLAGEGLALVEVVVQPVEDMSDWRNWRAGDFVVCLTNEYDGVYEKGESYMVKGVKTEGAQVLDDCGIGSCCTIHDSHMDNFKWHSRPAS